MAAALVPTDVYPVVRRFLLESGLTKSLAKFDKATASAAEGDAGPSKKMAKAIRKLELTAACQLSIESKVAGHTAVASDAYPVVRRFLEENSLGKTLKFFNKETAFDPEAVNPNKKLAKAIKKMELTAVCQLALESKAASQAATNGTAAEAAAAEVPSSKKRKNSDAAEATEAEPPKKKQKEAPVEEAAVAPQEMSKKEKKKAKQQEKTSGTPFTRVDYAKWTATIMDKRLFDNTHEGTGGDSWGNQASADLLKVKGKGFRKEMAKKKRASWKGGGEIDQGTYSIKLGSSSDDE